jgi:hypothetical protein
MSSPTSGESEPGAIPWWSSTQADSSPSPLLGLTSGVQAVMDWAREQVLAPHAEHGDPADHPQCLACRGQVVLDGLLGAADSRRDSDQAGQPQRQGAGGVQWIELDPPRA